MSGEWGLQNTVTVIVKTQLSVELENEAYGTSICIGMRSWSVLTFDYAEGLCSLTECSRTGSLESLNSAAGGVMIGSLASDEQPCPGLQKYCGHLVL